ncbi:MAG: hypothetical protein HYX48_03460 [Chlamydiales bacterium]|nr:hypothetical protein [Chlamydiales bacterium]
MSSSISPTAASSKVAPAASDDTNSLAQNAFLIIVNIMLGDMDAQQASINLGMDKEKLLKSGFDKQNDAFSAAEAQLNSLIAKSAKIEPTDLVGIQEAQREIQSQMSIVQAEGSAVSQSRSTMVQEYQTRINPAQTNIEQDALMFGSAAGSWAKIMKTR